MRPLPETEVQRIFFLTGWTEWGEKKNRMGKRRESSLSHIANKLTYLRQLVIESLSNLVIESLCYLVIKSPGNLVIQLRKHGRLSNQNLSTVGVLLIHFITNDPMT
jgi:hypothetical protein